VKIRLAAVSLVCLGLSAGQADFDFETSSLADWTSLGSGEWKWTQDEERGQVLHLARPGKVPPDPVRRPGSLLLLPIPPRGAFVMDLDVRGLDRDRKGADVCLFFGVQDDRHYYYAHISNDSDGRTHNVIMRVDGTGGERHTVQDPRRPAPALTGAWQRLRLERDADGGVRVYVDDMTRPVMTAAAPDWLNGRIGIGSFNDRALFDRITVR
jgi:hypothetical protein